MSKHTPGPWHYHGGYGCCISTETSLPNGAKLTIAAAGTYNTLPREEQEANGILMAAAPDMLDALCEAASVIECNCGLPDGGCEGSCSLGIVNAAIKKARGL